MSNPNFEESDFETDGVEDVAFDGESFEGDVIEDGLIEADALESSESDEIGETSEESPPVSAKASEVDPADDPKRQFSVFDAMLLISLICVTLATVLLLFALRDYGNFPSVFPWRTSEF